MDSEKILQLMAKQMGQAASEDEIKELKELLKRHPEYYFFKEILLSIEGERLHREPDTGEKAIVQESWFLLITELDNEKISNKSVIEERRHNRRIIFRKWMRVAAVLAGVMLISRMAFYSWTHLQRKSPVLQVVTLEKKVRVPYGVPRKMTLPDSSIVWLNAGSHIRYADNFIQKKREVYLDGEAYFEVKHDAGHPFLVHAGNVVIKVLGTEFNVQAYHDENHIETTLINGKVQVQITGKPDKKIVLTPHEKLTVINQEFSLSGKNAERKELSFQVQEVIPLQSTTPIPEVAWLQDKLAFQNESFDELSKKLARRYDVHIIFRDTLLENERLSGIFENETIQKALKLLQMTTPFHYRIESDSVYLSR